MEGSGHCTSKRAAGFQTFQKSQNFLLETLLEKHSMLLNDLDMPGKVTSPSAAMQLLQGM